MLALDGFSRRTWRRQNNTVREVRDRGEKRQTALSLFNLQTWILINPIYPKMVIYPNELYLQIRKHSPAWSWLLLTNASKSAFSGTTDVVHKEEERVLLCLCFQSSAAPCTKTTCCHLGPYVTVILPLSNPLRQQPFKNFSWHVFTTSSLSLPISVLVSTLSLKQKYSRLEENPSQGLYLFACMPPRSNPARRKHQQSETTSLFVSDL